MIKAFSGSLDHLYEMLDFIKREAVNAGFDSIAIGKIELASEEALVNIITYGFVEENGEIEIICQNSIEKNCFLITIKDNGIPYNPLASVKSKKSSLMIDERKLGGYGVYFILNMMDEVEYNRDSEMNILTLIKYFS